MKLVPFFLCALILLVSSVFCQKKVHVAIYYEFLCPDSIRFIKTQLEPNYKNFEQFVDIEFVPFGKSKSTREGNSVSFTCQHGTNECYGNKVHSCALQAAQTQAAQVDFVTCQMGKGVKSIDSCTKKANLSYEKILECSKSETATKLQLEAEEKTKQLAAPRKSLSFVPQVVYNKKYSLLKQVRSLFQFRKVLCKEIKSVSGQVPTVCA